MFWSVYVLDNIEVVILGSVKESGLLYDSTQTRREKSLSKAKSGIRVESRLPTT
jgi:hypothetical protein